MNHYQDLVPNALTGKGKNQLVSTIQKNSAWSDLADLNWPDDVSFGLNLQWPSFFPRRGVIRPASLILLTFHTENVDLEFINNICSRNPNSKILILYDGDIQKQPSWSEQVHWAKWITWGYQVDYIQKTWDIVHHLRTSKYLISSLSHRIDLFKCYVTSLLLQHPKRNQFLISWHQHRHIETEKSAPHLYSQQGNHYLDSLAAWVLDHDTVRVDDWYSQEHNTPVKNANWDHPAYTDSVINVTNESFWHTTRPGCDYVYPGPFFTEKTWKPIMAGCPFLSVGQAHSFRALSEVGFNFDYGLDISYDDVDDDLQRAIKLLELIKHIADMDPQQLISMTQSSADHNKDHVFSGDFSKTCRRINLENIDHISTIIDK
jgi:hypothetical protein